MNKKILVCDDEPNNLKIARQVLKEHYDLMFATSGEKALAAVKEHKPDLILLDIMMPEMSGYEVCSKLKQDKSIAGIPVIFITAMSEEEDEAKGFDAGAVDFIQKPISAPLLLRRVSTHLSLVRANELERSQKQAIFMLGEAGHYNDTDTGVHIWRMASYARLIAENIGWQKEQAEMIEMAAPMHDTGKIGIPDSILKAPRKLTSSEWEVIKEHTTIGFGLLSNSPLPLFKMASEIALCHHEKWNGTGYPLGINGELIPEAARIIAIADVFDALTMKRPYREAWSVEEAAKEIYKGSGIHFDPTLVKVFKQVFPKILAIKEQWDNKEKGGFVGPG